jgi:thiol-disulfide isomerase/thioredoxin
VQKLILSITLFCCSMAAFSQYDTTPPYLRTKLLPAFNLLSLDSAVFTQSVLKENTRTVIMLFNPECGHCQEQLETLLSIPDFVKNVQLVLSSTETLAKLKLFYDKNHLEKYSGVRIGKDYKYFFGGFYQPKTIPVLAFYNAGKQLAFFNQGNVSKKQLLKVLKQ